MASEELREEQVPAAESGAKRRKQRQRHGARERYAWIRRWFCALGGVLLFHGLFVFLVFVKARRAPEVSNVPAGETLRLWCMSAEDTRLSPLARDFLSLNEVLLQENGGVSLLDMAKLSGDEQQALLAIRLDWAAFTARLDSQLTTSALRLPRLTVLEDLPKSTVSLAYDLAQWSLDVRLPLHEQQYRDVQRDWRLAERSWRRQPNVLAHCYVNSAWVPVAEKELADLSGQVVRLPRLSGTGEEAELSSIAPCQMHFSVHLRGGRQGARVLLRESSGDQELDGLVRAWLLRRHGWRGHHQLTAGESATPERVLEYIFEIRRGGE